MDISPIWTENIKLKPKKKDVKLTFNYIGYKQLEKTVKNGTAGNFVMHEDADVLGEVVVTGYGTKNKNSFTGSQISVKKEDLMAVGTKKRVEEPCKLCAWYVCFG